MKRIICIVLTFFLMFSLIIIGASAAENDMDFALYMPAKAVAGDIISVRLSARIFRGLKINGFSGLLSYNNEILEVVNSSVSSLLQTWEKSELNISDKAIAFDYSCALSRPFHYLNKGVNSLFEVRFLVKETYEQNDILLSINNMSTAETEAASFGICVENILYGDVDFDNKIAISDAVILFQYVAGKKSLSDEALQAGDYNLDGSVEISDAINIFFVVSGKDESHAENIQTVAPTCDKEGYTLYTCSCGATLKTNILPALGHNFYSWKELFAPTPFKTGLAMRKCLRCGISQTKELAARRDKKGNITYYSQRDSRWASTQFGCGNMDRNGCAPTALAMALSYQGLTVEPLTVASWLYYNTEEFNRHFHGSSGSAIRLAAEHFCATVVKIDSYTSFVSHLKKGAAVVGAMGGIFCKKGNSHCIFMIGYNNGKVTCYDPYYPDRCGDYSALDVWEQRSDLDVDLRYDNIVFYALY